MYEMVLEALKRASTQQSNAAFAVAYECALTITEYFLLFAIWDHSYFLPHIRIYPKSTLLDAAAESVAKMLANSERNIKYLGLKALNKLVNINPQYALSHQLEVRSHFETLSVFTSCR